MRIRILAVSVALTGVNIAWGAMNEPIKPISAAKVTNPAQVELGKKLFFDRACRNLASSPATPATTCQWAAPTT